jgi:ribonuclease P protein component
VTAIVVLKKRPDFLRVAKGRRWHGAGMVVQFANRALPDRAVGVGYTASKKVGGAVVRNRSKRRLRALVRELVPEARIDGTDIVLIARPQTATLPFGVLRHDLSAALAKIQGSRG